MKSVETALLVNDKFVLSLACLDEMQRAHDFRGESLSREESDRVMRQYFMTFRVLDRHIRELRLLVQSGR
jgi:hypothetical protein